jgi:hypothetical protein
VTPEHRTTAAVALADAEKALPDWSTLPILADALEEAECDDAELLADLRACRPTPRVCTALRFLESSP